MTKGTGDPAVVLCKKRVKKWLQHSVESSWFVAGHTRFATRGSVNRRNSHPFRYGRIIGSHNGMCEAPQKFKVDSEHLFWALNKARGDYQKALEHIAGYWGLTWYDSEHFYLLCSSGELAYEVIDGVLYYSSSWSHLDSCTGGNSTVIKDGQVIRISADGAIANSSDLDSPIKAFESKTAATSYNARYGLYNWGGDEPPTAASSKHRRNYGSGGRSGVGRKANQSWQHEHDVDGYLDKSTDTNGVVRDYDSDWQSAWADYCSPSEHGLSDEEHAEHYAG